MSRALSGLVLGAVLLSPRSGQAAETACARVYRDFFDQAGIAQGRGLVDADLASFEELARARPARCAPGDYRRFIGRYADLTAVLGADGFSDAELHLLGIGLTLAPRRVASPLYEAAFQAFLDARTRLAAHLTPASAIIGLSAFDEARPREQLPTRALAADRDEVVGGLTEIRRLLALGEIADADARAQEMLRALQVAAPSPADGGTGLP